MKEGHNLLDEEVIVVLQAFEELPFLHVRASSLKTLLGEISKDVAAPIGISGVTDSVELKLQRLIEDIPHLETKIVIV